MIRSPPISPLKKGRPDMSTKRTWLILTLAAVLLAACGGGTQQAAAPAASDSTAVAPAVLSEEDLKNCDAVFDRPEPPTSAEKGIILIDHTRNVSARPAMDPALEAHLIHLSQVDGSLDIILVDGEGAAPQVVAKNLALSTAGVRDRPSVNTVAAAMPACVQGLIDPIRPTAPGTDLYRALSTVAELVTPDTQVFMSSDFAANSGRLAFTPGLLALDAVDAAEVAAASAPLDLQGARLHIAGVANTVPGLQPHQREWLRDTAVALCEQWNGTGCSEGIVLTPDNPTLRPGAESLPADPPLPFPEVTRVSTATSCTYVLPASLTFDGDSAELRPRAEEILREPVNLLATTPGTTAVIVGHTASSPEYTAEELVELSMQRARAVATYLREHAQLDPSRLKISGVGDTQPLAEDLDTSGRQIPDAAAAERRVDLTIQGAPCSSE